MKQLVASSSQNELTARQRSIVQSLVRRTPIKQIAYELEIAPSTVNDHIRQAKKKLGVNTTSELVTLVLRDEDNAFDGPLIGGQTKKRIVQAGSGIQTTGKDEPEHLVLSDTVTFPNTAPWMIGLEPRVLPEELDGPNAILPRLLAIGKTVALILAAVILSVTALQSVQGLVEQSESASTPR